jgi:holo-[acyl-carrier protein] synthase
MRGRSPAPSRSGSPLDLPERAGPYWATRPVECCHGEEEAAGPEWSPRYPAQVRADETPQSATSTFDVRVGCDVQSIKDVRASIDTSGERYLRRVLSDAERAGATRFATPELVARYVSGRFAAKEAVYKVLRGPSDVAVSWPQIEIIADETGGPRVRLSGAAAELSAAAGIDQIAISISHAASFSFAVATAIAAP